ncbi:MAG: 2-hydroxyacid dehydrogenase [Candidatus Bathyarchaeia archaeon]
MKCLIVGDPGLPSKYIYEGMRRLERYGVSFTSIDWRKNLSIERFYSVIMEIEREGVGGVKPFREMFELIFDKEILIVHFAPVSSQIIENGRALKIIGCARGGLENIDVKAAGERGITIINAPGRNADAVADLTMGLILSLVRRIASSHCLLKKGIWRSFSRERLPYDLRGKVLGVIGFGNIGREVAKRAKAFGMIILAYDPYVDKEAFSRFGAEPVDLHNLLSNSDVVSLHTRLTAETYHLFGEREFKMMKRTAFFINTARGRLVDERALVKALEEEWISGAALDVFEEEPVSGENPILRFENVVLTPHIAGSTRESILVNGPKIISDRIEELLRYQSITTS